MKELVKICVLYSEGDDKPIAEGKGWVNYFEKFFKMMLAQTSNLDFTVQLLSDEQEGNIENESIVIAILSPDFILSGNCLDRLEEFGSKNNDKLSNKIFKVFKTPLDYVDVPRLIRPLAAYELFYTDDNNVGKELYDFFSKEAEGHFWMKMVDLCFDVFEAYDRSIGGTRGGHNPEKNRKAIYLASTGHDLNGSRNIIKRELNRHGFEVYPQHQNFDSASENEEAIKKDLEKCIYSIHLLGGSYGSLLKNTDYSLLDLENRLSADHCKQNENFKRLIWVAATVKSASEKQKAFIHNIKRDSQTSAGAEVLQTSLEDFKNVLWEEILGNGLMANSHRGSKDLDRHKPKVYLIFDVKDEPHAEQLKKQLSKYSIEVLEMKTSGELMELRSQHVENLRQMDGAIVLQGAVNDQWVHMKLLDLLKAPGFGRKHPVLGRLMLTSSEDASRKLFEKKYQVKTTDLLDEKALQEFLSSLEDSFKENKKDKRAKQE